MTIKHRVKFVEHEVGFGETWYRDFDTKKLALDEVEDTNRVNNLTKVPSCYITAEYIGEVND